MQEYTLEELRNTPNDRFQQFPVKNTRESTVSSAVVPSTFSQKGNILSIYCSPDECFLNSVKVIITANLLLVSFTDC